MGILVDILVKQDNQLVDSQAKEDSQVEVDNLEWVDNLELVGKDVMVDMVIMSDNHLEVNIQVKEDRVVNHNQLEEEEVCMEYLGFHMEEVEVIAF